MKKQEETAKGLSRRAFLRNTAVGAGAAAVAGGTGLTAAEALQIPSAGAPPADKGPKYAWETAPAPIPADKIASVVNADVVVVGSGTSGLHAALAAAKAGAKVVLVEKTGTIQCRGGDNTALNTKIHKKLGIKIDENEVINALQARAAGRLNHDLMNLWAYNSGRIMDLIIDMCEKEGIPTYLVAPDRGDVHSAIVDKWPHPTGWPAPWNWRDERCLEFPTCHRPAGPAEAQAKWLKVIQKNAKEAGTEFYYDHKAVQLVRENKGRVSAVICQKKDGSYVKFAAKKAVIMCTGDYGFNREMLAKYCPQMQFPCMVRTSMGEGHQMAMWAGAVMENPPHAPMSHMFHVMGTDAFLLVNKHGRRFYNEDSDTEAMANQTYEQGGAWVVFDDSWPEDIVKMGPGFKRFFRPTEHAVKEFNDLANGKSSGPWGRSILKANTLEELAAKMKVPVDTFMATIKRYNELVAKKKDEDYGKRADRLTAIDKGPYYAEWTAKPSMSLVVMGGIVTDGKLRALDANGDVVPGLYLAGNTVGRRYKDGYPLIVPGVSHSMAWTYGYCAGEFAAAEKV